MKRAIWNTLGLHAELMLSLGICPGLLFSPTELDFSWLWWMQGSYSGLQDHISCVLHGNTCI